MCFVFVYAPHISCDGLRFDIPRQKHGTLFHVDRILSFISYFTGFESLILCKMYASLDLWDTLYLIRVFSFNSVYITAPNKIPGTPENSEG